MLLRIVKRAEPSPAMRIGSPLIAIAITVAISAVVFAVLGYNPARSLAAFFVTPVSTVNGISELFLKASPLILIACGLAVGFRANIWNIGGEGQWLAGAIAAGGVALFYPDPHSVLLLPLMFVAALLGGMAWATIPALLKTRLNTSEILTTLMLNYVALQLLSWLVHGPWRGSMAFGRPITNNFPQAAMWPLFNPAYRVNVSVFVTAIAVIVTWLFTERSFAGYKMSVSGAAPRAARFGGFRESSAVWVGLLCGGAAAGVAGMYAAAGPLGQLGMNITEGYGFAAIVVAFIGRLKATGIVLAGLVVALIDLGGQSAQLNIGIPASLASVLEGVMLLLLLTTDFLILYRFEWSHKPQQPVPPASRPNVASPDDVVVAGK